jgi:hypothetical protein
MSFSLSGYTPVVPTVTVTPSVTLTNTVPASGQVTFNMLDQIFSCVSVKILSICGTDTKIYTTNNLTYLGLSLTSGTTFLASITYGSNVNVQTCVTYVGDSTNFSSNSNVGQVYQVYSSCSTCSVIPTPTQTTTNTNTPTMTPTSTMTQTPTNSPTQTITPSPTSTIGTTPPATPTPTPTPTTTTTQTPTNTSSNTPTQTPTPKYVYVYETCSPIDFGSPLRTQIVQDVPHPNVNVGDIFVDQKGLCWVYLGQYNTNYTPTPPNSVTVSTSSTDYFTITTTQVFTTCKDCETPPPIVCVCYTLYWSPPLPEEPVNGFTNFQYIDCGGNKQNVSASDFRPTNVCAQKDTVTIVSGADETGGYDISDVDCCVEIIK